MAVDRAKETTAWRDAVDEQKSYLVQVLHWFYFRPAHLRQSWIKEEVLTWELLRALELLPQRFFIADLVKRITGPSPELRLICQELTESVPNITIEPYPSLKLAGGKQNSRSDIGFNAIGGGRLWLEAKTTTVKPAILTEQLQTQASALGNESTGKSHAVVALLPAKQDCGDWPALRWNDVCLSLTHCREEIKSQSTPDDLWRGYLILVDELLARIQTHPNNLVDS